MTRLTEQNGDQETKRNLIVLPTTQRQVDRTVAIDKCIDNEFAGLPSLEVI